MYSRQRRRFLRGSGSLVAGLLGLGVSAQAAPRPGVPGLPVTAYGQRARYETTQRWLTAPASTRVCNYSGRLEHAGKPARIGDRCLQIVNLFLNRYIDQLLDQLHRTRGGVYHRDTRL